MHKPYSAVFFGTPNQDEQGILDDTKLQVDFQVLANTSENAGQILQMALDFVMIPLTHSDKLVLQIFHQLREEGRTCVVVWGEQQLTGFSGRSYRWRKSAPKTVPGLERLLEWGKWPLPINRRMSEHFYKIATVTKQPALGRQPKPCPDHSLSQPEVSS